MNFKDIPVTSHPAYTWLWNSRITKEEIKRQIDEMYSNGIRAFYVLGEPKNFRPTERRTHLSPEYLSDEYIKLVYYAYEVAKEKGMYTWLYNEGGFPSGMACGIIREKYPHLAMKELAARTFIAEDGGYRKPSDVLSAFCNGKELKNGDDTQKGTVITEYFAEETSDPCTLMRTDNAKRENTDVFIDITHNAYKRVFGDIMGDDVTLMFDDEAYMGSWSEGLDKFFEEKYGYGILPYIPFITEDKEPEKEDEYRAMSDYAMLCGELVRENYFAPMKKWLNATNMLSTGHLDLDNQSEGCRIRRYGNVMSTLRAFDVPGVDVIWSQIDYPEKGKSASSDGMDFWTRFASSAARQQGHSLCVSESFAVYGSHVTPERMRFIINYQAIRGISRFNFMVVSYDRESVMCCQFRPSFISENPGMDMLSEINEYTARLSYILEKGKADVHTALYCPCRSICAGGETGRATARAFEKMGHMLEKNGVVFDIIDEEFVESATIENGEILGDKVSYKNVFVPEAPFEKSEIMKKLSSLSAEYIPCAEREQVETQIRKLAFDNGDVAYLVCNTSGDSVSERVCFSEIGNIYGVDLYSGEFVAENYEEKDGKITVFPKLLRGELKVYYITESVLSAKEEKTLKKIATITDISAKKVRETTFGEKGIVNSFFESGEEVTTPWDEAFSGEVEYTMVLPDLENSSEIILDMGEVRYFARVSVNGEVRGEKTMPPYKMRLSGVKCGDEVKILVANTLSNACAGTDFFDRQDIRDVGTYHEEMVKVEQKTKIGGGLLGPVEVYVEKE